MNPPDKINVLIVSDGKPGHQNQSLGIVERLPGAKAQLFTHGLKEGLREGLLRWGVGRTRGNIKPDIAKRKLMEIATVDELKEIVRFAPDLIISAGSTSATVNLLFKSILGIPSVCIMRPSLIPLSAFDLAIIPAHDAAPDLPNVVRTVITPNRALPEMASKEAEEFATRTGHKKGGKYLGIIIGGKAKGMPFESRRCIHMLEAVYWWARENDIILLLTTSRRTGSGVESEIEKRWDEDPVTGYMLLAGRDTENPTYAFHGLSGRALITADSMSMVSEAIYAGLKPVVYDISAGGARKGKRGRFYDGLIDAGYIDLIDKAEDIPRTLNRAKPFSGGGVPDELKECVRRIMKIVEGGVMKSSDSVQ